MNMLKTTQKGFTLLELMIVVAIIGILASIAVPGYRDYLKKGKAVEATSNLADLKIKAEQFFQDSRTYAGVNCVPTEAKNFTYVCTASDGTGTPNATGFRFTATGVAAQGMAGFSYSIDESNAKTSQYDGGTAATGCWANTKAGAC